MASVSLSTSNPVADKTRVPAHPDGVMPPAIARDDHRQTGIFCNQAQQPSADTPHPRNPEAPQAPAPPLSVDRQNKSPRFQRRFPRPQKPVFADAPSAETNSGVTPSDARYSADRGLSCVRPRTPMQAGKSFGMARRYCTKHLHWGYVTAPIAPTADRHSTHTHFPPSPVTHH